MGRTSGKTNWRRGGAICVALLGIALASNLNAQEDAAARGLAIAQEAADRDDGFGNSASTLTMVLRDARGRETQRTMESRVLETDTGDRSLIVFDEPKDVRGTALLTHNRADAPDDQWLYLPAVRRVKRIASTSRGGAFMGSEFAYEDFASQEVSKYHYLYLQDDRFASLDAFVIERRPKFESSAYGRQKVWIDQSEYRLLKVEYFDRRDVLLKTLVADEFERYEDRFWRPGRMLMTNHRTGRSTLLRFSDYVFDADFAAADFTPARLPQAR